MKMKEKEDEQRGKRKRSGGEEEAAQDPPSVWTGIPRSALNSSGLNAAQTHFNSSETICGFQHKSLTSCIAEALRRRR